MKRFLLPILALLALACSQQQAIRGEPPRSGHWPAVRAEYLKTHLTCAWCGCSCPIHAQVHHVLAFHLHPERELDPTNLIRLCECPVGCPQCKCIPPECNCHYAHGHKFNWRGENPNVRAECEAHQKEIAR